MNEGILWHQDPPFVADYMNFYLDKSKRILGVGSDNTNIKVLGATNGPIPLKVGNRWFIITTDVTVDSVDDLDTGSLAAGTDYYIYACDNNGTIDFVVSTASTYPSGYTASTSRKIGGFHTLSVDVGTISGHSLTGFVAKDILPTSIWCLKHRAKNLNNAGLVYDSSTQLWVQIYLASANGATSVQSVYNATILDTEDWNSFVERGGVAGMRLLTDSEFQIAARGTNEETNISGSADPVTTGGHLDTASRRMISNTGLEDMTGVTNQWLQDQSYRFDMAAANIGLTPAGATTTVYHSASPEGNQVYLKFSTSGIPYLCSNMATGSVDVWITLGSNQKFIIKHDANASEGIPVYMNRAATDPGKLLINNTVHGKNVYVATNYDGAVVVQLVHDASAATNGVALYYDDGADNRLEATFSNSANNTFDSAYFSPLFNYSNLPGAVGSLYKQGDYGDVKLLAGGIWSYGSLAGSRCRFADSHRSHTSSGFAARFACESL
jgi:hypothetical protein